MNAIRDPSATWKGVVMIIRPDTSRLSHGAEPVCRVVSKRDLELNGMRAIAETMPYALLSRYFRDDDGDAVEVYAELTGGDGGHLEFYERATKRDFFVHEAQVSVPAH